MSNFFTRAYCKMFPPPLTQSGVYLLVRHLSEAGQVGVQRSGASKRAAILGVYQEIIAVTLSGNTYRGTYGCNKSYLVYSPNCYCNMHGARGLLSSGVMIGQSTIRYNRIFPLRLFPAGGLRPGFFTILLLPRGLRSGPPPEKASGGREGGEGKASYHNEKKSRDASFLLYRSNMDYLKERGGKKRQSCQKRGD